MKLLLTAFDPFGGDKINPALEAVKLVENRIADIEVLKLEIPTVFRKSIDKLKLAIDKEKPDYVICVGQAGGRFDISIERVAINIDDARIKDNEGNQPIDVKIFEDGENSYFANLPIKAMVNEIKEAGLPASISNTAGTFVCNHLMYGLLYYINKEYPNIKGGFIHVPFIPEQVVTRANAPAMAMEDIAKALEAAILAISKNKEDIKVNGGREF